MKTYEIKNATAIHTGGGIYIYYGQLENGNYFRACDEWECIEICNSDTSVEDADYGEFYYEHSIDVLWNEAYETFWNEMLQWIINNKPEGNYLSSDLEDRFINKFLVKCAYSWGDEEPDEEFISEEAAWKYIKEAVVNEAETTSQEHDCYIGVCFDWRNRTASIHYTYDGEFCKYDIVKK